MTTLDSRRFDHIILHDFIGRGPAGDVYRARDRRDGRLLAAKLLHHSLRAVDDTVHHIRQVCRAIRQLNQPGILPWEELILQDGQSILVRDFADGIPLAEMLATGGPLPLERLLSIGRALAECLSHAHAVGPHLNLKPANILLAPDDGKLYLVDFHLPHLPPAVAYPCPQQCLGQRLGRRTDLWAFGALLYEMLTGRPPFQADTAAELCQAILRQPPPAVQQLRPDTPLALVELLHRLLAKHPADRPPDLRPVGALLEEMLNAYRGGADPDDPHRVSITHTLAFREHPFTQHIPESAVDEPPASQEFVAAVQRFQPDFAPTPSEMAVIDHIAARLDADRLALRLAAGLYGHLSLTAVQAEVERALATQANLPALPAGSPAVPAMLRKAFAQLSISEQGALVSLTVFRGGFSWPTARAICRVDLATLHQLTRRGFLVREPASGRYDLPAPVQTFAAERLARRPLNMDRLRAIHAACFGLRLENAALNFSPHLMPRLWPDLDNVRAAWEWATRRAAVIALGKMLETFFWMMDMAGLHEEALSLGADARRMLSNENALVDEHERREVLARLLMLLAWLEMQSGTEEESPAFDTLLEALRHLDYLGAAQHPSLALPILSGLAVLRARRDPAFRPQAVARLAVQAHHPSTHTHVRYLVNQQLAALESQTPAPDYAAAIRRAKTLDLAAMLDEEYPAG